LLTPELDWPYKKSYVVFAETGEFDLSGHDVDLHVGRSSDALIADIANRIEAARAAKNFADSDRLRDGLLAAGLKVNVATDGVEIVVTPDFDPTKLETLR
jgi:cysteinyl-tRNA synthetase